MQSHQCCIQVKNHFPSPDGHAVSDAGQDAINTVILSVSLEGPSLELVIATLNITNYMTLGQSIHFHHTTRRLYLYIYSGSDRPELLTK